MFHAVVPVQLITASNQVVATVLSDGSGRYAFTNVPPADYQIRCQVLNGYRYLGVSNLVTYADVASATGVRGAERFTLIPGRKIENADFTFAPFKKGTWKTFTTRDGLAGNEVRKVLPLDDGTIWIGTMSGISIFDGATFKNLHKEDGLPDNRILNLYHNRRGPIWICTGNGVARYDPSAPPGKRMRSYTSADGLFPGEVHAVCQTPDDAMWFAYRGISRFDGSGFKTLTTTNQEAIEGHVMKMAAAPDGTIWLGGILGLGRFNPANFTAVLEVTDPEKCDSPMVGPDGNIWFVSHNGGVYRMDPSASPGDRNRLRKFTRQDGLLRDNVITIHFTSDGALWAGGFGGSLSRFDGTNCVNFTPADGIAGSRMYFISSTRDGVLWFGTDAGLTRYDPVSFESYTVADGLAANGVSTGCRLPDGSLWFGSDVGPSRSSGLNRYAEGTFFETPLPAGDRGPVSRMRASANSILVTGEFERSSAYRLDGSRLVPVFTSSSTDLHGGQDVIADRDGVLWLTRSFNGDEGLWRTEREGQTASRWTRRLFEKSDSLPEHPLERPGRLELDDEGRLWVGSFQAGTCRLEKERSQVFTTKEGLAGDRLRMIWNDHEGSIWFATEGGASRYDGKQFHNFTSSNDRLASDSVFFVGRDARRNLWFGTDSGVTCFDGRVWCSFDSRDGLIGDRGNHVLEDTDGTYWISTERGVTHYHPRHTEPQRPLVSTILDAKPFAAGAELPAIEQGRAVRFKLDVNDLRTLPETRRFRYQVVSERRSVGDFGDTNGWVLTGKASEISWYTNQPGDYTLAVQYIDRDLNYSKLALVPLTIFAPWYANAFIMVPSGGAALGLIGWAFVARALVICRKREAEQLREQMLQQEREARKKLQDRKRSTHRWWTTWISGSSGRIWRDVSPSPTNRFVSFTERP